MQIALLQLPASFLLFGGAPKARLEDTQGPVFADACVSQRQNRATLCRNQEHQTRRNRAERIAFDHRPLASHRASLRRLPAGIQETKKMKRGVAFANRPYVFKLRAEKKKKRKQ